MAENHASIAGLVTVMLNSTKHKLHVENSLVKKASYYANILELIYHQCSHEQEY